MTRSHLWIGATFALATLAGGCGAARPTTSAITGTIAQATFPAKVTRVTVVSDGGAVSAAAVDASGKFRLTLQQGASYRFFLSPDGKGTPLVVRSEAGRLETTVSITGGGATADIGSVRYWAGASRRRARSLSVGGAQASAGACVSGTIQGTQQPCASGTAGAVCADEDGDDDHEEHGHHGGGCPNMGGGSSGEHDDAVQNEDGQNEDGQYEDGQSGQNDDGQNGQNDDSQNDDGAASGGASTDASAAQSIGVPEHNLPATLGCEDGEEHHHHHHGD